VLLSSDPYTIKLINRQTGMLLLHPCHGGTRVWAHVQDVHNVQAACGAEAVEPTPTGVTGPGPKTE